MKRAAYWPSGSSTAALVGVLLAWRLAGAPHAFQDYFLMLPSAAIGVGVLPALAAVRAHSLVWLTYAYLATPFFALFTCIRPCRRSSWSHRSATSSDTRRP